MGSDLQRRIRVVIDLEGGIDQGVSTRPGHLLYLYHPIFDEQLPDLPTLHAVGRMAADLIRQGHRVLAHCGMGFNRSALVAGVILTELGMTGSEAVQTLRARRPGALFNEVFADYLASLPAARRVSRPRRVRLRDRLTGGFRLSRPAPIPLSGRC